MRLPLLLLALCLLGARPTTSHVLAWTSTAVEPDTFVVEQCTNAKTGCVWAPVATVPGSVFQVEIGGLQRQASYCWRVYPTEGPLDYPRSNMVCL